MEHDIYNRSISHGNPILGCQTQGVPNPVAEDHRSSLQLGSLSKDSLESVTVEDVVPQNEAHAVGPDELLSDDERLGKAFRTRLSSAGDPDPPLGPFPEEVTEARKIDRRGNEQGIPDPRQIDPSVVHIDPSPVIEELLIIYLTSTG